MTKDEIDGLIKDAREFCGTSHYLGESPPRGIMLEMIAALKALRAENERLRAQAQESREAVAQLGKTLRGEVQPGGSPQCIGLVAGQTKAVK